MRVCVYVRVCCVRRATSHAHIHRGIVELTDHTKHETKRNNPNTMQQQQERHVRRAFVSAGLPASITNLDVLPADVVRFR